MMSVACALSGLPAVSAAPVLERTTAPLPVPALMPVALPAEALRPAPDGAEAPVAASPAISALRRYSSRQLLGRDKEVLIEHQGSVYRLRQTALGKLILTK